MIWAFWIDSVPITRAVLDGTTSLGGSESACLGLMRALAARGHLVHAFTPKLAEDAVGPDGTGLAWHKGDEFHGNEVWLHTDWDVYVSLRMPYAIGGTMIPARWRILWNQDLLIPSQADQVMGALWQADTIAYVSAFHRHQWEGLIPGAAPLGWVTRNGYDPAMVPGEVTKAPARIIHVSRPERAVVRIVRDGMRQGVEPGPLLQMWPQVKAQRPDAELHLCRYSSMYDAGNWGKVCEAADELVAEAQRQVGGIVYLGELGKPDLYRAIAESAVMWYPGVVDFAETGCIAAVEAQACGTPFIGSYKGALPETAPHSVLVKGDASSPAYQAESVAAVLDALDGCRHQTRAYRERQEAGRRHVTPAYTYDALAAEWEAYVLGRMEARAANRRAILQTQLLCDDHTAARLVASALGDPETVAFCDRVIDGKDQTAEDYAERAIANPLQEMKLEQRFDHILGWYAESTRLLDVACGNGTAALKLALTHPHLHIVGVDYSERNLERARGGAATLGVSDRVSFVCLPVYDYQTHDLAWPFVEWLRTQEPFDALFCGEFLEHCANAEGLIDGLEQACRPGASIGYTMPHGPFSTLMPRTAEVKRGHVHALELDDLGRLFGAKEGLTVQALNAGLNKRSHPIGFWLVHYQTVAEPRPAQPRDYAHRIRSLRPQPRLSALLIVYNEAGNLASCLESIWGVADEIVIGDCGSTDETRDVAARYGARVVPLPRISAFQELTEPDGQVRTGFDFSDARNTVLQHCTGDWVLWIDADETLEGANELGKYLTAGPFLGYAIRQVHLAVDIPKHHDLPVRCFRRRPDIRWYGSIHEQPQLRDCNTDITPALELPDVQIAHRGYRTEGMRQQKRKRNLPLLELDRQRYPDRRLGLVLWLRDLVLEAEEDRALHGGRLTPKAANYLTEAIDTFEEHLNDPTDKLYQFSRPWYESAVKLTKEPWEFVYTLVGQQGGLNGTRPQLRRVWVRQPTDIEGVIASDLAKIKASLEPKPLVVDPPDKEAPGELAPQ